MHRVLLPNQLGNQGKPPSSATKTDIEKPAESSEADSDETVKPEKTNPTDSTEANAEMTLKQGAVDQPSDSASDMDKLQVENKERQVDFMTIDYYYFVSISEAVFIEIIQFVLFAYIKLQQILKIVKKNLKLLKNGRAHRKTIAYKWHFCSTESLFQPILG